MAYLDNTTEITIDAVLTKKGREKLASGTGNLSISKFALSDDEIDYTLYDRGHPQGSAYYDAAIRALPVLEASVDETKTMRYKLVTMAQGSRRIPTISVKGRSLDFVVYFDNDIQSDQPREVEIEESVQGANSTYTLILADDRAGRLSGQTQDQTSSDRRSVVTKIDSNKFTFFPRSAGSNSGLLNSIVTSLTIIGDQTGATFTMPISVEVRTTVGV